MRWIKYYTHHNGGANWNTLSITTAITIINAHRNRQQIQSMCLKVALPKGRSKSSNSIATPSRAPREFSDPRKLSAIGSSCPKTSPEASLNNKWLAIMLAAPDTAMQRMVFFHVCGLSQSYKAYVTESTPELHFPAPFFWLYSATDFEGSVTNEVFFSISKLLKNIIHSDLYV